MNRPRERAIWIYGFTGKKSSGSTSCWWDPKSNATAMRFKAGRWLAALFPLPVNNTVDTTPDVHSSGGKKESDSMCHLQATVALEIASHRRSGKVTARKTNRTAFFGQPAGWLFFYRSERSIERIAPAAAGNGTTWTNKTEMETKP